MTAGGGGQAPTSTSKVAIITKVKQERTEKIVSPRFHKSLIYLSCWVISLNIHVRVIRPKAVDHTIVIVYSTRLKGGPDEMNFRLLNVTQTAAFFVKTDDREPSSERRDGAYS